VKSPTPDELRKLIDEALAEIEETEHNVIALFEDIGGPDLATGLLTYYERAEKQQRLRVPKLPGEDG
jgi:hypothetical protein